MKVVIEYPDKVGERFDWPHDFCPCVDEYIAYGNEFVRVFAIIYFPDAEEPSVLVRTVWANYA